MAKKKSKKKSSKKKTGGWRQHPTGHHKKAKKKRAKKARKKSAKKHDDVGAHMRAANRRGVGYGEKVTLHGLQEKVKRKRGKRWLCAGPVRSGCGGSDSKVVR